MVTFAMQWTRGKLEIYILKMTINVAPGHSQMIASLKCQYAELLAEIGFIQADLTARKMGRLAPRTGDGVLAATGEMVNHTGREGNNRSDRHGIR